MWHEEVNLVARAEYSHRLLFLAGVSAVQVEWS